MGYQPRPIEKREEIALALTAEASTHAELDQVLRRHVLKAHALNREISLAVSGPSREEDQRFRILPARRAFRWAKRRLWGQHVALLQLANLAEFIPWWARLLYRRRLR